MIGIFIASSERFQSVNWLTRFSIEENTQEDVNIHVVMPRDVGMSESGCTGFSVMRYAVPELCRERGYDFGIYLDCDMVVLGDITELYQYATEGHWVTLQDGSDEVSVICASMSYPPKECLHKRHKGAFPKGHRKALIPNVWNVEDRVEEGMKLLHFTALDWQPWFHEHPNKEAVDIYREYYGRHHNRQREV